MNQPIQVIPCCRSSLGSNVSTTESCQLGYPSSGAALFDGFYGCTEKHLSESMNIAFESPRQADVVALVAPHVLFAVARDDEGLAVACGAIVLGPEFCELKRMFVKPAQRGRGLAGALLRLLEDAAASHGCTAFALETGYLQPVAVRLYERFGYVACGPFGEYRPDPNSVFMRKRVS